MVADVIMDGAKRAGSSWPVYRKLHRQENELMFFFNFFNREIASYQFDPGWNVTHRTKIKEIRAC